MRYPATLPDAGTIEFRKVNKLRGGELKENWKCLFFASPSLLELPEVFIKIQNNFQPIPAPLSILKNLYQLNFMLF